MAPIPKPKPHRLVKAARKRHETAVKKSVRAQVVERDGYCVVAGSRRLWPCEGVSEWAHIEHSRRCFTRGMPAEQRHTTQGSAMMCHKHHTAYDAHAFDLVLDTDTGMDGPFTVRHR